VPEIPGLFVVDGDYVVPTPLCRGPWDKGALHGGAITGLVGWAAETAAPSPRLVLTRLTVELWHLVPLEPLRVTATVVRPGRRAAVIDVEVRNEERLLVRASSQWALPRVGEGPLGPGPSSGGSAPGRTEIPARPDVAVDPSLGDFDYPRPGFNCDAAELRPFVGSTEDPGPGVIWARVRQPVVAGQALTPLQLVATLCDLGAAVGWEWSPTGAAFINPDVTLQLVRYPEGEWVCLDSRTYADPAGIGFCETILWDDLGRFGRVLQSQVESPHTLRIEPAADQPP
jgi:hypothetical protein